MKPYTLRAVRPRHVSWKDRNGEVAGYESITPETVGDALEEGADPSIVALDVLAVIGKQVPNVGAEDASLCSFIAYRAVLAALDGTSHTARPDDAHGASAADTTHGDASQ